MLIRCDASAEIGLGHLTRCRALAVAARGVGLDAAFAIRDSTQDLYGSLLQADGFDVHPIDESRDAQDSADLAREIGAGVVLVDHYEVGRDYFAHLRDSGLVVAVIDDRADRDLKAADWLLNQNLAAAELQYDVAPGCTMLLGVQYALLRPAFRTARQSLVRSFSDSDNRLLVAFGGGDTTALVLAALRSIEAVERPLDVRVVVGRSTSRTLIAELPDSHHSIEILRDIEDVELHMAWADISVNAGGSTCWELMCLGVPMVVTSASADQTLNQQPLVRAGVALSLADVPDAGERVERLLHDAKLRRAMSTAASGLVDGLGASRAAASLAAFAGRHDR